MILLWGLVDEQFLLMQPLEDVLGDVLDDLVEQLGVGLVVHEHAVHSARQPLGLAGHYLVQLRQYLGVWSSLHVLDEEADGLL